MLRTAATVGLVGVVALWWLHEGTFFAHLLLAVAALLAAGWLSVRGYRAARDVSAAQRGLLVALRCAAWAVVLLLLVRPVWDRVVTEWQKPALIAFLDQSGSMDIDDLRTEAGTRRRRAMVANEALVRSESQLAQLAKLYDVHLLSAGTRVEPLPRWTVAPSQGATALSTALNAAAALRSSDQRPAQTVLLISDGAENVHAPEALRRAARELAEQHTALVAVGVGPRPGSTPVVELEPLSVPDRVGRRDTLRVPVVVRAEGCDGHALGVEVLWNEESAASERLWIRGGSVTARVELAVTPPGPGLHRLTARVQLPEALGGGSVQRSQLIDVDESAVRVLLLEGTPRAESAFLTRAWQGDPRIDVSAEYLFAARTELPPDHATRSAKWEEFDVIVLGQVPPWRLSGPAIEQLAYAVSHRGVGLLLAGGQDFFNERHYKHTPLGTLSPVDMVLDLPPADERPHFLPTDAGLRHPALQGLLPPSGGSEAGDGTAAADSWATLPPLGAAARFGAPKPLATTLAQSETGRPLLVAQEVGRGRCAAAAWESTWPWALASDDGPRMHTQLWRQLVVWLANRRPHAWVVTDEPTYDHEVLGTGQRHVTIRAGVAGVDSSDVLGAESRPEVTLRMRVEPPPSTQPVVVPNAAPAEPTTIPLSRVGDEWQAELPSAAAGIATLPPGGYTLEFTVRPADGAGANGQTRARGRCAELEARTMFSVVAGDLEHEPPTANLALLRDAAELTRAVGGRYADVSELPDVLRSLTSRDRRRRVDTQVRYDPVSRDAWWLLAALVVLLGTEWAFRRSRGLA